MIRNKNNLESEELRYKLIVIGDELVGKTAILNRFKNNQFNAIYEPTVGLEFQSIPILIDDQSVNLLLYDVSGHQKFRSLIPLYASDVNIILLIYDISKNESFNNIDKWFSFLNNINKNEVIFALVGNKSDLDYNRKVKIEEAEKYAKDHKMKIKFTSAYLDSKGVRSFLDELILDYIKKINAELQDEISIKKEAEEEKSVKLVPINKAKKRRKCC